MFATVCEVDRNKGFVRIDINGRVSNWLPCVSATPAIGQQVAFIESSIDGSGVVIGSTSRSDGAAVDVHIGSIDITVDGESIVIKGNADITGEVKIVGDLIVDGEIRDKKGNLTNFTTTDGAKRA